MGLEPMIISAWKADAMATMRSAPNLERKKGLEPSTVCLEGRNSTIELLSLMS